jgi:hypothetical protein
MRTQVIQDHDGTPTGVFIPIKDWEKMKKKYHIEEEKEDSFEFSEQQKKILDERLKADKKDFIPAREAQSKLREKYGL